MKYYPILLVYSALPLVGIISVDRTPLIAAYFLVACLPFVAATKLPTDTDNQDRIFQLLILSASIFFLITQTMISTNIVGYDIHQEFYDFLQVSRSGVWNPGPGSWYGTVLSVTLLPTILETITALDGVSIFKFVFPLIYSLVPLILYRVFRKMLPAPGAFVSVFLFMANRSFFFEHIALARQEIAEVFLSLLLLILVSNELQTRRFSQSIVIILLTAGLITAHYSLAFIYVFLLAFSFVMSRVFHSIAEPLISVSNFLLTLVVTAAWYALAGSGARLQSLVAFMSLMITGFLTDFFNAGARPGEVNQLLGFGSTPGILHVLFRVTYYLVNLILFVGFVALVLSKQKGQTERKMLPLMTASVLLMIASVVVPFLGTGLDALRTYHIILIFVAPCLVFGVEFFASSFSKLSTLNIKGALSLSRPITGQIPRRYMLLAGSLLLLFLLFNSGWVYAVALDNPTSFVFDRQRMLALPGTGVTSYYDYYVPTQDVVAALWLGSYAPTDNSSAICADSISTVHVLSSYAGIGEFEQDPLFPNTCGYSSSGYVYLSVLNTHYNIATYYQYNYPVSGVYANILGYKNRLYTNGGSDIYGLSLYIVTTPNATQPQPPPLPELQP